MLRVNPRIAAPAAALLAAGCLPAAEAQPVRKEAEAAAPAREPVLVRKLHPDAAGNAAAGSGVLTLRDGCLFMAHRDGSRTLLLWPAETRLERAPDGELRVLPGGPGHTVRVGEEIFVGGSELGGGEGDSAQVGPGRAIAADAAYPQGCSGRFWNIYTVEPGPPAEMPTPDGRLTRTSQGAAWGPADWPRLTLRCAPDKRAVELTASGPVIRRPGVEAGAPAALELSSRQSWARYPVITAADGVLTARAPASDAFLDRLVDQGFTVRAGAGVTQLPPGGETLAATLRRCRA